MKLKSIAAAALWAATGLTTAAPIDRGIDGSGDFFFSIWDSRDTYTTNLNLQQDVFDAAVAAPGAYIFMRDLTEDSLFTSFIGSARTAELQWNVLAVDGSGARTLHTTYNTPPDLVLNAHDGRTMIGVIQSYLGALNDRMDIGGNSAVINTNRQYCNNDFATQAYSNCGTLANNSYGSGLGLAVERFNGTGLARGTFSPVIDNNVPLNVWLDGNYILRMTAPVPEPETYALLLAGLGLLGAVARRRQGTVNQN